MQQFLLGILFGVVSMTAYGVYDIYLSRSSKRLGSFRTSFWTLLISLLILMLPAAFLLNPKVLSPWIAVAVTLGACASISGFLTYTKGLEVGSVSTIATVSSAWGAVTAVLGFLFLGEKLSPVQALYVALIVVGTVLVSMDIRSMRKSGIFKAYAGFWYALATVIGWGIFYVFVTYLTTTIGWFQAVFLLTPPSILLLLAFGAITRTEFKMRYTDIPLLVVCAVLGLLGFVAYSVGTTYSYADIVAPITAASPIVTVLLAVIFLKDKFQASQVAGLMLVIAGLVLLSA